MCLKGFEMGEIGRWSHKDAPVFAPSNQTFGFRLGLVKPLQRSSAWSVQDYPLDIATCSKHAEPMDLACASTAHATVQSCWRTARSEAVPFVSVIVRPRLGASTTGAGLHRE
jgi:hypothetical protein